MQRTTTSRLRLLAILPMGVFALWGAAAQAQAQAQDQDHVVIGMGAGYMPAYEGADKYRTSPVPVIDVKEGRFFANMRNGVGVDVLQSDHVTVGASVAFLPGYRRRDVPEGVDKLKMGAGGRVFVSLNAAGFIATIGVTEGFSGTKGAIADAGLSYPISVTDRFTVIPSIGATWTDKTYNDHYFGVDASEALASGLPQFTAGSGFKDASALLTLNYRLTDRINLGVSAGVTTLLGDDQDSPLVVHKTQPVGFFSLSYRLGS